MLSGIGTYGGCDYSQQWSDCSSRRRGHHLGSSLQNLEMGNGDMQNWSSSTDIFRIARLEDRNANWLKWALSSFSFSSIRNSCSDFMSVIHSLDFTATGRLKELLLNAMCTINYVETPSRKSCHINTSLIWKAEAKPSAKALTWWRFRYVLEPGSQACWVKGFME